MYNLKKSLIGLTGVVTLVAGATVTMPHIGRSASGTSNSSPTSQTQNVNVVNTPAVNAQQSGAWNVGISGTPVVGLDAGNNTVKFDAVNNTVKIDAARPVLVSDVDNPARRAIQASVGPVAVTAAQTSFVYMTHVPVGSRLVIEQVTSQGSLLPGAAFTMQIGTTLNGAVTYHALVVTAQGSDGNFDYFASSQVTRLYADPDTDVTIQASGVNGGGTVSFSISGYLVNP